MKTLRNVRRWCEWFCIVAFAISAVMHICAGNRNAATPSVCAAIWAGLAKAANNESDFWRRRYCHAAGIDEQEGEA